MRSPRRICRLRRSLLKALALLCCTLALPFLLRRLSQPQETRHWAPHPPTPPPPTPPPEAEMLALIRNGSVRCSDIQAMFPHRIPPVVHWTNRDHRVLFKHQAMLLSWHRVLGNSVAYMYWDDKAAEELIRSHYPLVWQQYRRLRTGLTRSDIARLAILHHTGGVYADLDVRLLRSLHPLRPNYTAVWSQEPTEHIYYMYKRDRLLSNAVYLTRARHEFLGHVLKSWPAWFEARWAHRTSQLLDTNQAIHITGPIMLNHFLDQQDSNATNNHDVYLAHPDLFQPTWDGWFAQRVSRRECGSQFRDRMPLHRRQHCDRLRARGFKTRPLPAESYTVHKFMHTSYGGRNSYANARSAGDVLPLSRCVI